MAAPLVPLAAPAPQRHPPTPSTLRFDCVCPGKRLICLSRFSPLPEQTPLDNPEGRVGGFKLERLLIRSQRLLVALLKLEQIALVNPGIGIGWGKLNCS